MVLRALRKLLSVCSLDLGLLFVSAALFLSTQPPNVFSIEFHLPKPQEVDPFDPEPVRRTRADELEGLLADADAPSGEDRWQNDDAAADADTILLHSRLGPQGAVPLARGVVLEDGDEALHVRPNPAAPGVDGVGVGKYCTSKRSTDDLLARAALDAGLTQLKDVNAADLAKRARRCTAWLRRSQRCWVRPPSSMDSLAAGVGSSCLPRTGGYPAPLLQLSAPAPDTHLHLQAHAEDDEDAAADLDRLAYARLAPWGGGGGSQSQSRSSGRSSGSASRASCSPVEIAHVACPGRTRASRSAPPSQNPARGAPPSRPRTRPPPPPTRLCATQASSSARSLLRGTPGGLSTFNDEAAERVEEGMWDVVREALPSRGCRTALVRD
ncbi:hypothetical protein B0H14DRAFT_3174072 [Mycena olivaceomarginata]|nr:hypothetical protein B0H14DRAFT_3174072 [Mycena olivaceomarginata]